MTRDELIGAILGASSPKPMRVEVDDIGPVYVKVMTAYDADMARNSLEANKKEGDGCDIGRLLASMLCDDQGELLFLASDVDAVMKLSKLPPKAQTVILSAANQANTPDPK